MTEWVYASKLVAKASVELGSSDTVRMKIFGTVPLDFRVRFDPTLPLFAHLLGMQGITLGERVYLRGAAATYSPATLLLILRHEAAHVGQQRADRFFYLHYAFSWISTFLRELVSWKGPRFSLRERCMRAYLAIPQEVEAYSAERQIYELLQRYRFI